MTSISYTQVCQTKLRQPPSAPSLLPCPFCGGRAEFRRQSHGSNAHYVGVKCADCKVLSPLRGANGGDGFERAAEFWNRRAIL